MTILCCGLPCSITISNKDLGLSSIVLSPVLASDHVWGVIGTKLSAIDIASDTKIRCTCSNIDGSAGGK